MGELYQIVLFAVGVATGVYASVAGGGALMLVPTFLLFGIPVNVAIGTMRAGALVQELATAGLFWKKGFVKWRPAIWTGVWSALGGMLGAYITVNLDLNILSYIVAIVMLVLLFALPKLGRGYKVNKIFKNKNIRRPVLAIAGFLLGVYGGFYGAGFGTFAIFLFAWIGGWNMLVNVANARVVGFMMSASASIVFFSSNDIDWVVFFPVTAGLIIGSVIGVNWATRFGSTWVKVLITVVVIASSVKLIFFR